MRIDDVGADSSTEARRGRGADRGLCTSSSRRGAEREVAQAFFIYWVSCKNCRVTVETDSP